MSQRYPPTPNTPGWMADIAYQPLTHSATSLAIRDGLTSSHASKGLSYLHDKAWIDKKFASTGKLGRPAKLLYATPTFWKSFDRIARGVIAGLEGVNEHLFNDALNSSADMAANPDPQSYDHLRSRAQLLGNAAILGESIDLAPDGWFTGQPGWEALIRIQALRVFATETPMGA